MNSLKRNFFIYILLAIALLIPFAGEMSADDSPDTKIYFRPAVRWGTNDRVLYVMDFLVPLYQGEKNIIFLNTKFTPDNHDGWETNLGLGYRHMVIDDSLILGTNLFYDHRRTMWGSHFDQIGVGVEAMAEVNGLGLTGRMNYYHPLSGAGMGTGGGYAFYGSGIHYAGFEEPMTGFDYEAGFRIPYISDYAESWVYAGGYHFYGDRVSDVNGISTRFEIIPTDFIRLNLEYRHDNVNESEFYTEVALEVPFSIENLVTGKNPFEGFGSRLSGSRELSERMVEPVRRDVDIFTGTGPQDPAGGIDPGDLVCEVIFVSEGGETDGARDGTFEHPWASIAEAMSDPRLGVTAFTIHVLNDETGDLVAGGGTVDLADLLIWGSGVNHPGLGSIINMPAGYPALDSTLTLNAENLFVTGLGFDMGYGFTGDYGIDIQNSTGITIWDNYIDISGSGTTWGIYAFCPEIGSAKRPLLIGNNYIAVENNGGGARGIHLTSNTTDIFATITGNDMSNTIFGQNDAYGIYLYAFGNIGSEDSPLIVSNNPMSVESDIDNAYGTYLYATNDIFATITGNDMSNTIRGGFNAYGIRMFSDDGNIGSETRPVLIQNNPMTVTADVGSAYGIYADAYDDIFARIIGNDMSNTISGVSDTYGIYLDTDNGDIGSSTRPLVIADNRLTVTSSGSSAYGIWLDGADEIFSTIKDNRFYITAPFGAYAAYLTTFSGLIGDITSRPTYFVDNVGTVDGAYQYLLYLDSGASGGGNWVRWNGNHFTSVGGVWSGNYGPNNEVWHNFTGSDVITP